MIGSSRIYSGKFSPVQIGLKFANFFPIDLGTFCSKPHLFILAKLGDITSLRILLKTDRHTERLNNYGMAGLGSIFHVGVHMGMCQGLSRCS